VWPKVYEYKGHGDRSNGKPPNSPLSDFSDSTMWHSLSSITGADDAEIIFKKREYTMKNLRLFLGMAATLLFGSSAYAIPADFDFSGAFSADNDIVLLDFSVGVDSNITIFSSSWGDDLGTGDGYVADAGFDPILAIWDSFGNQVAEQDDGSIEGTTASNGTDYTHGVWDSFFDVFLVAGDYTASIAQYDNFSVSTSLADGFINDGNANFTTAFGAESLFNGVWSGDDSRTGDWAFHILNVEAASQTTVPEPSIIALFAAGLFGIGFARRRKA